MGIPQATMGTPTFGCGWPVRGPHFWTFVFGIYGMKEGRRGRMLSPQACPRGSHQLAEGIWKRETATEGLLCGGEEATNRGFPPSCAQQTPAHTAQDAGSSGRRWGSDRGIGTPGRWASFLQPSSLMYIQGKNKNKNKNKKHPNDSTRSGNRQANQSTHQSYYLPFCIQLQSFNFSRNLV